MFEIQILYLETECRNEELFDDFQFSQNSLQNVPEGTFKFILNTLRIQT